MEAQQTQHSIGDLHTCVCGETATPQSNNAIPCKQMGCESKWVSRAAHCNHT